MGESLAAMAESWAFGVFLFALGLCLGSFLNVCIHRLPAGKSLVWPGSHCPKCVAPIAWYDNLPVISYFVLGGRCRTCGAAFSARYMAVELVTGLLLFGYWIAYFKLGVRGGADHPGVYGVHMVLVAALLVCAVIDLERKEIYTSVTQTALVIGIVGSFLWPRVQELGFPSRELPAVTGWWTRTDAAALALVGAAVGAGIVYVTKVVATRAFKKEAMGLGDVYLMAAVGAVLGWVGAVLVFFTAPFLALPYGVWNLLRYGGSEDEAEAEDEVEEESAAVPDVPWGALAGTLVGFTLLATAGLAGIRSGWSLGPRVMVGLGLAAFAVGFRLAVQEEDRSVETGTEPPRAPASHEVPYGPFLGLSAALMMLVQDVILSRLGLGAAA
jgi:leader peptidase (prepilin peptidase)/N-methyltransferase